MGKLGRRTTRRASVLGAVTAALAISVLTNPTQGTYAGWSQTLYLEGAPRHYAAVDLTASIGGSPGTSPDAIGDQIVLSLPEGFLAPLADPDSGGVATALTISGYAQGTQAIHYGIAEASGTNGYQDVRVELIDVADGPCTPQATGTTLISGTGLTALQELAEQRLDDAAYSISTTPTRDHLCLVLKRPGTWSSTSSTTASLSATADAGTPAETGVSATSAPWTVTVDRSAESIDGKAQITLSWTVKGA